MENVTAPERHAPEKHADPDGPIPYQSVPVMAAFSEMVGPDYSHISCEHFMLDAALATLESSTL